MEFLKLIPSPACRAFRLLSAQVPTKSGSSVSLPRANFRLLIPHAICWGSFDLVCYSHPITHPNVNTNSLGNVLFKGTVNGEFAQ